MYSNARSPPPGGRKRSTVIVRTPSRASAGSIEKLRAVRRDRILEQRRRAAPDSTTRSVVVRQRRRVDVRDARVVATRTSGPTAARRARRRVAARRVASGPRKIATRSRSTSRAASRDERIGAVELEVAGPAQREVHVAHRARAARAREAQPRSLGLEEHADQHVGGDVVRGQRRGAARTSAASAHDRSHDRHDDGRAQVA